jgi:hypothetical protein
MNSKLLIEPEVPIPKPVKVTDARFSKNPRRQNGDIKPVPQMLGAAVANLVIRDLCTTRQSSIQ